MASQDGQPDRILRGCTQPTLAQDLPEPAAGPPAGGALEAAAGPPARRWCFGGGSWSARPLVVLWRRRLRRARQASTRAASVAGSWRQRRRPVRVRAVARSTKSASATASRGRRVCPRRRSWPSIPASHRTAAAEPRQPLEVGDGGGRVTRRPCSGFSGARRGRAAAGPSCPFRCGCAVASQQNRSGRATTRNIPNVDPPTSSRYTTKVLPHLRRYVRRPAVLPPSVFLAPSLLPAVRLPSTLPTPPATPVAGVVPGVVLPDAPATLPLSTCFLRCVPPAALPLPSRLVLGLLRPAALPLPSRFALASAQRPCRCQLPSSAQRSCRSSQATRDASRIALSQHFCACARVVPFCNFVCYTFC